MSKKLINKRAFSLTHARSARSQRQKPVIRLASRMKSPPLPALKSFDLSSPIDRRQNSSYITPRKQNSTFTYDTFRSQSRGRKGANSYSTNTTTFYNTFDCQSSEIADGLDIFQVKRLYDAKCDDIGLVKLPDQQARFIEYCRKHFKNRKFKLVKHGLGPKSSRVITEILHNNVNFGYLILAQNNIGDKGIQAMIRQLRKNRALVHLDISNNDITQEGAKLLFEMMTHHQSIIHLDVSSRDGLRRNRLGEIGSEPIGEVLRWNWLLSILNIAGTSLGWKGIINIWDGLQDNQSLISLNISSNEWGWKPIDTLMRVVVSSSLQDLSISDNQIGNKGCAIIAQYLSNSELPPNYLSKLDLSRNDITEEGSKTIWSALHNNSVIKFLKLSHNPLNSAGVAGIVSALRTNTWILALNLTDCKLGCEGAEEVGYAIARTKSLRSLSIAQNACKDDGAKGIARGIRQNRTLTFVDLSTNKIKEAGGAAVAEVIKKQNRTIEKLLLADNYFNDNVGQFFLDAVRFNSTIQKVKLSHNPINDKYTREIQRILSINQSKRQKQVIPNLVREIKKLEHRPTIFEEIEQSISHEKKLYIQQSELLDQAAERLHTFRKEEEAKITVFYDEHAEVSAKSKELDQHIIELKQELDIVNKEGEKARTILEYDILNTTKFVNQNSFRRRRRAQTILERSSNESQRIGQLKDEYKSLFENNKSNTEFIETTKNEIERTKNEIKRLKKIIAKKPLNSDMPSIQEFSPDGTFITTGIDQQPNMLSANIRPKITRASAMLRPPKGVISLKNKNRRGTKV